ncbi:MAG: efflux RND transporter periplasmic adaptor subunit [Porphyromonas sp.]|nr:efflux RND transporter periplasmic adaptor subunit [Porphyromonas sp.]
MKKNRLLLVAFVALLFVILVVSLVGLFALKPQADVLQGQVEADEYRVSSKVPGRIKEIRVREGQTVHAGDTLAVIEAPEVAAKMEQARAAELAAEAQNAKAIKGARQEQIQAAYEMWQKAKAGVDIATKTHQRVQNLFAQGVMPAQKLDEATAQRDAALATERAAQAQYDMARNGAEREDKLAASALVGRARGAVAEVEAYVQETYLVAMRDGEVSEIFPKVGELVGTGAPIMNVAELGSMWVSFALREDYLSAMPMGAKIKATAPALPDTEVLELEVTYVKDMGSYATWKATKASGGYDLKTFEVRARLSKQHKTLRPGMTVIVQR